MNKNGGLAGRKVVVDFYDSKLNPTQTRNAEISAEGILPFCQDTGTATVIAKKGQQVWTGANDAEYLSQGFCCLLADSLHKLAHKRPPSIDSQVAEMPPESTIRYR